MPINSSILKTNETYFISTLKIPLSHSPNYFGVFYNGQNPDDFDDRGAESSTFISSSKASFLLLK